MFEKIIRILRRAFYKIINFFRNLFRHDGPSKLETWAEEEVRRAIKYENLDAKSEDPMERYAIACYNSALKALVSLAEDRHSGMSIQYTKDILNRLIDWKPLTPVCDAPGEWSDIVDKHDNPIVNFQHKRYGSLFKYQNLETGEVYYRDYGLARCINLQKHDSFSFGLVTDLVHTLYPIKMPYMPTTDPINVYVGDVLTDSKNGDFDTFGIFYLTCPHGDRVEVNMFYKEDPEIEGKWIQISHEEWIERVAMHEAREKASQEKQTL